MSPASKSLASERLGEIVIDERGVDRLHAGLGRGDRRLEQRDHEPRLRPTLRGCGCGWFECGWFCSAAASSRAPGSGALHILATEDAVANSPHKFVMKFRRYAPSLCAPKPLVSIKCTITKRPRVRGPLFFLCFSRAMRAFHYRHCCGSRDCFHPI